MGISADYCFERAYDEELAPGVYLKIGLAEGYTANSRELRFRRRHTAS